MMNPNRTTRSAMGGIALLVLALVAGCTTGHAAPPPPTPAPTPPPPTTCSLRASANNAVVEITGVRAEQACREWQQWSLKAAPDRALVWSETRPVLTYADGTPKSDVVKETCRYTLGAFTYSVTDTGTMNIGTGWCQELYTRAVKAG